MTEEQKSKGGRTRIGDVPLTPSQLQGRHRAKLREQGHKIIQATIRDPELVKVLQALREKNDLKSDTAALNWVVHEALTEFKSEI